MKEIDWSKAPEWATRYCIVVATSSPVWANENQYEYLGGFQKGKIFYMGKDGLPESQLTTIECRPAPWTGTGLPPVGTVCEFMCTARGKEREWQPALVKYASLFTVVLDDYSATAGELEGEFVAHPDTMRFRPIRTPEQIAAEEREKAIKEMIDDYSYTVGSFRYHLSYSQAERLYDAGYRKTEAKQ